jgi:hypothetical protein
MVFVNIVTNGEKPDVHILPGVGVG